MSKKNKNSGACKPKISKLGATALVVILGVLSVYAGRFIVKHNREKISAQGEKARAKGNPRADFKIVEYIDFQCPACAKGSKIIRDYVAQYPTRIYVEMKYFPLSQMHKFALLACQYAQCAARQDKFWPMHDALIDDQSIWDRMLNAETMFREMAGKIGLDKAALDACLADKETEKVILSMKEHGKSLGVQSTPTYFVNGKMSVGIKSLQAELEKYFGPVKSPTPPVVSTTAASPVPSTPKSAPEPLHLLQTPARQ